MDSGSMERKMELQEVFMMKTSLLSRLKMQREDAAHAEVMGACHSLLARSKEMTGMMEQARRKLVSASHLFSITHNIYQVASIGMTSSAQILNRLASRDAHIESDLRSKLKSPQSQSQSQLSFVDQSSARAPSRFELRQAALRTPSSLSSSSADGSNFFSSGTNTSTSSLSGLAAAASAAAHIPPAALLGKPPLVRDADQAPASLQRTAASILRAASASPVRHPPHTSCFYHVWFFRIAAATREIIPPLYRSGFAVSAAQTRAGAAGRHGSGARRDQCQCARDRGAACAPGSWSSSARPALQQTAAAASCAFRARCAADRPRAPSIRAGLSGALNGVVY